MLIDQVIANINSFDITDRTIDFLNLEWFESKKRILRRKTVQNQEISIRLLGENQELQHGDILFMDTEKVIVINILECDVIKIYPDSITQMGQICYEIGNKHLPLFLKDEIIAIPFEEPIFRWLLKLGFKAEKTKDKLLNRLSSSVAGHGHNGNETSFFEKIVEFVKK